jgi:hypothetical protein
MKSIFITRIIILLMIAGGEVFATLPAATAWEVRPTVGTDTNGGCFVVGSTGTDFSQQNSAQYSNTDLATGGANNEIVSAGHSFVASDIGNCIHITAGTGFTVGFYQIVSVAVGTGILDRDVGTAPLVGGTYAVGGALATIAQALTGNQTQNIIFVKQTGTYQISADLSMNNSNPNFGNTAMPNQIIGYKTTRTDGNAVNGCVNCPIIQLVTNTGLTAINGATGNISGWFIRNLVIDCNGLGSSKGITTWFHWMVHNVKITNCTSNSYVADNNNGSTLADSEITGATSSAGGTVRIHTRNAVVRTFIHDNTTTAIYSDGQFAVLLWNLVTNNSGGSSDCFFSADPQGNVVFNNTFYACGQDGISFLSANTITSSNNVRNNIIVNMGRFGFFGDASPGNPAMPLYDGNAYFNNASGDRLRMDDTGTVNAINAAAPYTNIWDITLTGDPFTNAAGGDFTLNSTAGAGAAVRAGGTPGPLNGITQVGHVDLGALQHLDSGGGGSTPTAAGYVQ